MSGVRFDRILEGLVEAQVEFVLIGGLALNSWGVVRGTKDVDVVVSRDSSNLKRLAELAQSLGGHVQGKDAFASSWFAIAAELSRGERVLIETPLGPLDVVQGLPGVPSFDHLVANATKVPLLGVDVPVCSLADLRAMKRAAGRTRDLADLEDLAAARGPDGA